MVLSDADLSLAEGVLREAMKQGDDAFTVSPEFFVHALVELRRFRSGELVQMPKSIQHAEAMHLVADRYLKDNRK